MKKNFDNFYEECGGTYREENGYFIPNLTLPEQTNFTPTHNHLNVTPTQNHLNYLIFS